MGSFEKKFEIFPNGYMWQFFSRMRLKWFFLKMSFHFIFEIFLAKIRKKFKVEKVRKYDKSLEYFQKQKTF